jgi:DNA-binding MarR family transcriptional regulator
MTGAALAVEIERLYAALVREGGRLGLTEDVPLSPTQRLALVAVVDEGPLRLGALADAIATTDATATRTVQSLERHGLVTRSADAADRRGVVIAATREGRHAVARGRRRLAQTVERLLAGVAEDDRDRLVALLRELTGAVAR